MKPVLVHTIESVRQAMAAARARKQRVSLVPTMGALHEGHASLIRQARAESDFVVVSIFVNPTQFGPHEDFHRYPRPLEADLQVCEAAGGDLVFQPEVAELYPPDYHTYVTVEQLQDVLCGASRPGHFRGVATIVLKLFNIVQPDLAFFGQKDAQQVRILQQMVRDLNVPVQLRVAPIVRAADGLALSSRNQYLDPEQRQRALVLSQALEEARQRLAAGERAAEPLRHFLTEKIASTPGARLDYVAVVDAQTLQPVEALRGQLLVALAVFFGQTRLIDNLLFRCKD
jgi:pantoate--beta-alanine ligase